MPNAGKYLFKVFLRWFSPHLTNKLNLNFPTSGLFADPGNTLRSEVSDCRILTKIWWGPQVPHNYWTRAVFRLQDVGQEVWRSRQPDVNVNTCHLSSNLIFNEGKNIKKIWRYVNDISHKQKVHNHWQSDQTDYLECFGNLLQYQVSLLWFSFIHTWYLSILVHHHTSMACKKGPKSA